MASNAVESVKDAWSGIKEWFSNTWQGIKNGATGLFDKTVETSMNAVDSVKTHGQIQSNGFLIFGRA